MSERPEQLTIHARYIVFVHSELYFLCDTLAEACDWRKRSGGIIYEPVGLTTTERVHAEPTQP